MVSRVQARVVQQGLPERRVTARSARPNTLALLGGPLSSAEAHRFLLVGGGHQYVMTSITRIGITSALRPRTIVVSAPSAPVESLLARLEGVRRQGGFYRAFCPAHDDRRTPNLDIKEGEDGRVLLLCRAGCSTEEVVESLGLKMRDLFSSNVSSNGHGGGEAPAVSDPHPVPPPSCTLETYARAKRLPVEFLKSLGLSDVTYSGSPAIRIPYRDQEGRERAVRFRRALKKDVLGDDRFRWKSGSRTLPYGLWRLVGAREADYAVLVEGE